MFTILQATYFNGTLIPDRQLRPDLDGKTLKIIILEPDDSLNTVEEPDALASVEQFLEHVKQYSFKLPSNYTLSRDEIYNQ
jgi:hypothetical protein